MKTACTAVFVDNVADRFDSYAVSGVFGGLENIVFLLYFAIEGILHMDQKEMIMVGINFHINLSAGGRCFYTCLDGIFQDIGKHKAQINLIYGKNQQAGKPVHEKERFLFLQWWNNIRKHCQQPDFHRNAGYSQRFCRL